MKILGIDPGYSRVGWGIISYEKNNAQYLNSGLIETNKDLNFNSRLNIIYDEINLLIYKEKVNAVAVESLYFNKNAKTAILAAHARGVICLAGIKNNIPVYDYTPLQVKNALIGYGRADKKQIQTMLSYHLKLKSKISQDDTADALAIALTHAYTNTKLS